MWGAKYTTKMQHTLRSPLTIKVQHDGDIRRFSMEQHSEFPSFINLRKIVASLYNLNVQTCHILWKDTENDKITIGGENDLAEMLVEVDGTPREGSDRSVLRLDVVLDRSKPTPVAEEFAQLNLDDGLDTKGGRGKGERLNKKAAKFLEVFGGDLDAAKAVILKAWEGDEEAKNTLHEAKRTRMAAVIVRITGKAAEDARMMLDGAIEGNEDATAALNSILEEHLADLRNMMRKTGCFGGRKDKEGKGKWGKGKGNCQQRHHGRPLVHALIRLGMHHEEARHTLDAAREGCEESQQKIGAVLDQTDVGSSKLGSSSTGTSSEEGEGTQRGRRGMIPVALKLLKHLAMGEVEAERGARRELHGKGHGKGHEKGHGKGWGKGWGEFAG